MFYVGGFDMKNIKILLIIILSIMLVGCGSTNNKILGIIELNKTTRENVKNLNLEMNMQKTFNQDENIYDYYYVCDYADYTFNDVNGIIEIYFENETAKSVIFSAEATENNMNKFVGYLVDTYGKDYEEIEDYTTRWTSGDLIIDYVLTDDNTVEIRWYNE